MPNKAQFIYIRNVFSPGDRVIQDVDLVEGEPLSYYLPSFVKNPMVTINDDVIDQEVDLSAVYPQAGSHISFCDIPLGGNGGKNVMRMAAFAAVSYYSGPLAAKMIGSNTIAQGLLHAGMMTAGSSLVNTVLPAPVSSTEKFEDSASYGVDGAKNTSQEGLPIPMPYGVFRTGGNIVSLAIENETAKSQIVHMMVNAGEGTIDGISDLRINDQPIENYADWAWAGKYSRQAIFNPSDWDEIRTSSEESPNPAPGSDDAKLLAPKNIGSTASISKGQTLSTTFVTHQSTKTVDAMRLDLVASQGLFTSESGDIESASVGIVAEIKERTGSTWRTLKVDMLAFNNIPHMYVYDYNYTHGSTDTRYIRQIEIPYPERKEYDRITWGDGNTGTITRWLPGYREGGADDDWIEGKTVTVGIAYRNEYYSSSVRLFGQSRNALRYSLMTEALDEGLYDIRIKRTTEQASDTDTDKVDTIVLTDVVEIESEKVGFRGTAMLAVRIRLSDQISSLPKVTYVNHGRLVKVWSGTFGNGAWINSVASKNPAWVAWDMLTNYHASGQDDDRLDLGSWLRWAEFCEDESLEFNGIFDSNGNVWDALQIVLRVGRAQIIPTGTKYTIAIERPDVLSMIFGNGNIIEGTLNTSWLPMEDRANEVEVAYYDKDDDYQSSSVKVASDVQWGQKQRLSSITMKGVTNAEQATKEAWLHINMNKFIRQSATFETTLDALAAIPGDVIRIQSDHPQWGFSGRTKKGGSLTKIKLDSEVFFEGTGYSILIHYPTMQVATGVVTDSRANAVKVMLTSTLNSYDGLRVVIGGVERAVGHVEMIGGDEYWMEVTPSNGLSGSVKVVEVDVFVQRAIATTSGKTKEVNLSTPLTVSPPLKSLWMIGKTNLEGKPFRLTSVEMGSDSYQRKINCLEYSEYAYEDVEVDAIPTDYSHIPKHIEHIRELQIGDTYRSLGETALEATAIVNWKQPAVGIYDGAQVYVSINGGSIIKAGSVSGGVTEFQFSTVVGAYLVFKIVAVDVQGRRAPNSSAPTAGIYMDGVESLNSPSTITISTPHMNAIYLKWGDVDSTDYAEVYRGTSSNLTDAKRIDKGRGGGYVDYVEADILYYYWVRFGDSTGQVWGEPTGPVSATAFGYAGIEVDWDDIAGEGFDAVERMTDNVIPPGIHVGGFGDLTFKKY